MKKPIIFDYYNLDLSVTYVEHALSKKCPLNWTLKMIDRAYYGLVFILDGEAEYVFSDRVVYGKKNDIVYFKKGESYVTHALGGKNLEYCVISFDMGENDAVQLLPFSTVNHVTHILKYKEMFQYIEEACYVKNVGYKILAKSLILSLIYELLQEINFNHLKSDAILFSMSAVLNYIENNIDRKIDIDVLANISGYSSSHFRKKFREIYGISPVEYINYLRIEKAKDLLKSRMYLKHEIAKMCGFENVYYFSRVFKKIVGCPPKEY